MKIQNEKIQISYVIKQRNVLAAASLAMVVVILLQTLILFSKDSQTIVMPSEISKEYIISRHKLSKSYLEDMSRDIITTLMNLTPANTVFMKNTIMKMVHPSAYGDVEAQLDKLRDDVTKRHVSTVFYPDVIAVNDKKLIVQIEGEFLTFVGNEMTSKDRKTFEIGFRYTGAKLTIGDFHEIIKENK